MDARFVNTKCSPAVTSSDNLEGEVNERLPDRGRCIVSAQLGQI